MQIPDYDVLLREAIILKRKKDLKRWCEDNYLTKRKSEDMNTESTNDNCKINDDVDKAIDAINRNKDDWHYNKTTGQIEKSNLLMDRVDLILQHIKINDGISDVISDKLIDINETQQSLVSNINTFIEDTHETFTELNHISSGALDIQRKHHTIMEILESIRSYINSADNVITAAKLNDILMNQKSTSDILSFIKDDNKEVSKDIFLHFHRAFSSFEEISDNQKTILKNQSAMIDKSNQINDTQSEILNVFKGLYDQDLANDIASNRKMNDIVEKINSILERLGPGAMVHING